MDSSNRPSALPGTGKAERGDGKPEAAPHQDEGQLVSRLREHLPAILSGEPVQLAYLYGSTVTGLATPLSDVDYLPIHRELQEAFFQDVRERGLHG
jgi:hypothetical protein